MLIDRSRQQSRAAPAPAAGVSSEQLHIRKLTDNDQATDVAISPDGRYVAFVREEEGRQSLWLRRIDTRTDVEILPSQGVGLSSLTFSPDGSLIYFVKHHAEDPFAGSLYSMSMLGGAARKVLDDIKSPISFSPDGKRFVYESCWSDGVQLRVVRLDRDDERQLAAIPKANCVVFQHGPSWSPDGRTIVAPVFLFNQQWLLASVSADDGTVRELLSSRYRIGRPMWLPGGHSLLVPHAEEMFREFQLWTVTFPGGEVRRLSDDLTWYDQRLDATPDGRTAVSIVSTRISNIWAMPVEDPMQARQVSSGLPVFEAAELANGRILAVDYEGKLWTMDRSGGHRTSFSSLRDVNTFARCGNVVVAEVDTSATHGDVLSRRRGRFTCNPLDRGNCFRAARLFKQWRLLLLREPGPGLPDSAGGRDPTGGGPSSPVPVVPPRCVARWRAARVSAAGARRELFGRMETRNRSRGQRLTHRLVAGSIAAESARIPMVPPGRGLAVPEVRRRRVQHMGPADGRRQREAADHIHVREGLQL